MPIKVVQSLELGDLETFADAFLPAAAFIEKDGHVTNWEGRGQRLGPIRGPQGISLPDWEIFASLALACGGDLGFETLEELHEEMGRILAPSATEAGASTPGAAFGLEASPGPAATDGVAAGSLRLFTYPLLVDEGRLSERADELKAALQEPAFVEVHPRDAEAAGLVDGGRVLVRTDAGVAELDARVTDDVAVGAVFVPFNQPGLAANTLLSGELTTEVTLEAVAPASAEGAEPQAVAVGGGTS